MQIIDLQNLAFILFPVSIVLIIIQRWGLSIGNASYALIRMLGQLLLIGYVLEYIFAVNSAWSTLLILGIMCFFSSWIALASVKKQRKKWILYALPSILIGGGVTLATIIFLVLELEPWYEGQFTIPLAGMIFASCMNSISLAADRFLAESTTGQSYRESRNHAFKTAMIPTINGLFAVGLVSLPGMMTGQILSGISPFIAARYQIMVMLMIFVSAGLSAAVFLTAIKPKQTDESQQI